MPFRIALAASLVAIGACAGGAGNETPTSTTSTTTTAEPTTASTTSTTSTTAAPTTTTAAPTTTSAGVTVDVDVADGRVSGGGRVVVGLGEQVTLRVTSDVADEIHVHGYDLVQPVGAGETAELSFAADVPGIFEVELEDAHLELVSLEVR